MTNRLCTYIFAYYLGEKKGENFRSLYFSAAGDEDALEIAKEKVLKKVREDFPDKEICFPMVLTTVVRHVGMV